MITLGGHASVRIIGTIVPLDLLEKPGIDVSINLGEYPDRSWVPPLCTEIHHWSKLESLRLLTRSVVPILTRNAGQDVLSFRPRIIHEFEYVEWTDPLSLVEREPNFLKLFPNSTPWTRQRLASSIVTAGKPPYPMAHIVQALLEDSSKEVRAALANNEGVPFPLIYPLLEDECSEVRGEVLTREGLPIDDMFNAISNEPDHVIAQLAFNPKTPDIVLRRIVVVCECFPSAVAAAAKKLITSKDAVSRVAGIQSTALGLEHCISLIHDTSASVRMALIQRIARAAAPSRIDIKKVLKIGTQDPDKVVASAATRILNRMNTDERVWHYLCDS